MKFFWTRSIGKIIINSFKNCFFTNKTNTKLQSKNNHKK
jgi:hypothetical protein